MLVDLGLAVYAEDFEKPFLTATAEFYMVCCSVAVLTLLQMPDCGNSRPAAALACIQLCQHKAQEKPCRAVWRTAFAHAHSTL